MNCSCEFFMSILGVFRHAGWDFTYELKPRSLADGYVITRVTFQFALSHSPVVILHAPLR